MTERAPSSKRNTIPDPEGWERRTAIPFPRSFFQLQYDFTEVIAERNGQEFFDAIKDHAPYINRQLYEFERGVPKKLLEPDPGESIVDFAYNRYLKADKESEDEPTPYNSGTRFGCFAYNHPDETPSEIDIHFVNAELDTQGPLSKEKIFARERELIDMLKDVKKRAPHAETVLGHSWLYNLDAYKRLFPDSYIKSLKPDEGLRQWSAGTTIWGQFIDSEGNLKEDLAKILMERVQHVEPGNQNELLTPPLMVSLYAEGPIADFYEKYQIS